MHNGDLQETSESDSEDSIAALFARLIEDAEHFVRAELRLYRADLFRRLREARSAIILILIGFLFAQSAIIALLVGLIVILRPVLGAIGATASVVGGSVIVAAIMARIALGKLNKATEIKDSEVIERS